MLDKNTNANIVRTAAGYIFSKHMYCDMQFLVVKINAFPCILNGDCSSVPEVRYWIDKLDHCVHYNLTI